MHQAFWCMIRIYAISWFPRLNRFLNFGWIHRLNSGEINGHNFLCWRFFLFQKLGTDSMNYADSRDIKILTQFPRESILKFSLKFSKYVACVHMCFIIKITQCIQLFMFINSICEIRGYLFDFSFPNFTILTLLRSRSTLVSKDPNAHARVKKLIFHVDFPEIRFVFI